MTVLCDLQKLFELEELTAPADDSDRERGMLYPVLKSIKLLIFSFRTGPRV